jgi:hypothetical protein
MRCRTGRGERVDLRFVLTSGGDGRRWPDLKKLETTVAADNSLGGGKLLLSLGMVCFQTGFIGLVFLIGVCWFGE